MVSRRHESLDDPAAAVGAIAVPSPGLAQSRLPELSQVSPEDLMAIGQNLFDAAHAEFAGLTSLLLATQVRPSASLRVRWTSR
jgi:hypothetical protein